LHCAELQLLHLHVAASHRIWQALELFAHLFEFLLEPKSMVKTLYLPGSPLNLLCMILHHPLCLEVLLEAAGLFCVNLILSQSADSHSR
jgi:hypothetical protein